MGDQGRPEYARGDAIAAPAPTHKGMHPLLGVVTEIFTLIDADRCLKLQLRIRLLAAVHLNLGVHRDTNRFAMLWIQKVLFSKLVKLNDIFYSGVHLFVYHELNVTN